MLDKAARQLPPLHTMPLDALRALFEVVPRVAPPPDVSARECRVPVGTGAVTARLYRPPGLGPFPITLFFHGGGWCLCSVDSHDHLCRALCRGAATLVIALEYRRAPEHAFPAASDDCLAALRWASDQARALEGDPDRLSVAGDSAGGNLALVTSMRARDEGGPPLRSQVLVYPVTDAPRPARPSYAEHGAGFGLTTPMMERFWQLYVPDSAFRDHPHAAPLLAPDLSRLPRTLLVSSEYDVLRDEGDELVRRLQAEGTPVTTLRADGMNHGYLSWPDRIDGAVHGMAAICSWLRTVNGEAG